MSIERLLEDLWKDYEQITPQATQIQALLKARGERVLNDHVAFRTYNHPSLSLEKMARGFLELGYQKKGDYAFKEKKLRAQHFEPQNPELPKVFISELLCEQLSTAAQKMIAELVEQVPTGYAERPNFCVSGRPWRVRYETYLKLVQESEYAGWMSAFGFRVNHFTVNVNALKSFPSLADLNAFLKTSGFALNSSGGEIKGGPEVYLEQSSTLAPKVRVSFEEGVEEIPSCYYEFAKRYPLPNGELYQGFVEKSADKIFESTNRYS